MRFVVKSPKSEVRSSSSESGKVRSHTAAEEEIGALHIAHCAFANNSAPKCSRAAFTLVELMIAMGIGFGVIAASFSAYFFISSNGRALESQIEFSDMYRSLYANYTEIIEDSRNVVADDDGFGVTVSYLNDPDVWIGYVEGDDAASSKLVVRSDDDEDMVLCSYVSPVHDSDGKEVPMFTICGHSVILNVHIGDRTGAADATGPGYQGVVASIAASSRNLRRKL